MVSPPPLNIPTIISTLKNLKGAKKAIVLSTVTVSFIVSSLILKAPVTTGAEIHKAAPITTPIIGASTPSFPA